ncbi:MAG: 7-cyano-7-deazaguanine synthase QueC [Dehalococcoidia bacterium]|nr:7-cyano-7-deazaguanine synthase QueC [Dehalococcoidia bacterium]
MRKIGVVLLSGGLDSTTVAAFAKAAGYELVALTFDYGQRHRAELKAARKVARIMGVRHEVVDLPAMKKLCSYSALTSGHLQVPRGRRLAGPIRDIPPTYVPLRNTVFLTLGAALLESTILSLIDHREVEPKGVSASLFIAANAVDYSGYPDCRPEYFQAMQRALTQGTKLGCQYGITISVETPVLHMSKADIVRLGIKLGAPFEHTWSCYEGGDIPCGSCDSCLLRARGFAGAGIRDPLLERLQREGKIAEGQ